MKILAFAAALTAALPAFAGTPFSFEQDGTKFAGTIEHKGATEIVVGHELQSGKPFRLKVINGQVSGTYNTTPVNYALPAKGKAAVETASR